MLNFKNFLILFIAVVLGVVVFNIWNFENKPPSLEYSIFLGQLQSGEIQSVHIRGGEVRGNDVHDQPFSTFSPDVDNLVEKLIAANITFSASAPVSSSPFWTSTFPVLLLMAFWVMFMVRQQKGGESSFGKGKAKFEMGVLQKVTFDDVAGVPEAKGRTHRDYTFS